MNLAETNDILIHDKLTFEESSTYCTKVMHMDSYHLNHYKGILNPGMHIITPVNNALLIYRVLEPTHTSYEHVKKFGRPITSFFIKSI
jgi:hypothetical protein